MGEKCDKEGQGGENVDAVTMMVEEECSWAIEVRVGIYARLRLRTSCIPA